MTKELIISLLAIYALLGVTIYLVLNFLCVEKEYRKFYILPIVPLYYSLKKDSSFTKIQKIILLAVYMIIYLVVSPFWVVAWILFNFFKLLGKDYVNNEAEELKKSNPPTVKTPEPENDKEEFSLLPDDIVNAVSEENVSTATDINNDDANALDSIEFDAVKDIVEEDKKVEEETPQEMPPTLNNVLEVSENSSQNEEIEENYVSVEENIVKESVVVNPIKDEVKEEVPIKEPLPTPNSTSNASKPKPKKKNPSTRSSSSNNSNTNTNTKKKNYSKPKITPTNS